MYVQGAQPNPHDPPHFIADDTDGLREKLGDWLDLGQCDGCGNHSYQLVEDEVAGIFYAECKRDPDDEFARAVPCGHRWRVYSWHESEVAF